MFFSYQFNVQIVKKVVNYRRLCDFHNSAWKKSVEKKQELEIKSKDAKTVTTSKQVMKIGQLHIWQFVRVHQ